MVSVRVWVGEGVGLCSVGCDVSVGVGSVWVFVCLGSSEVGIAGGGTGGGVGVGWVGLSDPALHPPQAAISVPRFH